MRTSVLSLVLLMVASVLYARPTSFDDTFFQQDGTTPLASVTPSLSTGGEEGAGALGDDCHQVLQGLLQEAERRAQEVLALLKQRAAALCSEDVRQMEQERDDAIRALQEEFSARMQRVEQRLNGRENGLISLPTRAGDSVIEVQDSIDQSEKRVLHLEETGNRTVEQAFPSVEVTRALLERNSSEEAPIDIPPAPTGPSSSTSTPARPSISLSSDSLYTTLSTSFSSTPTSTSTSSPTASPSTSPRPPTVSAPEATATGGAETDALQEEDAGDEQRAKERVELRIQEVKAKRGRSRANPSSMGEMLGRVVNEQNYHAVRVIYDKVVNYTNKKGRTPFLDAVCRYEANAYIVSILLKKGADVNAIDVDGMSPLHYAAHNDRNGRIMDLLIRAGADVDARERDGATPLHFAASYDNAVAVRALLAAGAKKSLKSWSGRFDKKTPFDVAASDAIRDLLRP